MNGEVEEQVTTKVHLSFSLFSFNKLFRRNNVSRAKRRKFTIITPT